MSCHVPRGSHVFFFLLTPRPPRSTLFPYTTLFRSSPRRARRPLRRWTPRSRKGRAEVRVLAIQLLRSEEHTSELQSQSNLVCRLLLEKKKTRGAQIRSASWSSRNRWPSSTRPPSCQ